MSLFLDQKYLLLVSNRLPLFKKKNDATYNCRCILCGDSSKKVKKARGYFFQNKNNLMYKCFNCDASMFFGTFLKQLDGNLYNQYSLENYTEGKPLLSNTATEFTFEQPTFKTDHEKLFDKLLTRLDLLPEDHEVVKFCHTRQISKHNFKKLYFIDNIKNIVEFNEMFMN